MYYVEYIAPSCLLKYKDKLHFDPKLKNYIKFDPNIKELQFWDLIIYCHTSMIGVFFPMNWTKNIEDGRTKC